MIRFQRKVTIKRDKAGEAREYLQKLRDYIATHYPEVKGQGLYSEMFGLAFTWIHTMDFESLTSMDAWVQRMAGDDGFKKLRVVEADLYVDGTIVDSLMSSQD